MYKPGTHIIATLTSEQHHLLDRYDEFKIITDNMINQFHLEKLGEVYHNFSPAGFTAVICLSESHISIHTWPEYGLFNMDIYLSNFQRTNDETVQKIYQGYVNFFSAALKNIQTITR